MTGEKIEELGRLLNRRRNLVERIEKFKEIFKIQKENISFSVIDNRSVSGKSELMFVKEDYGLLYEALEKVYTRTLNEFNGVQEEIDKF